MTVAVTRIDGQNTGLRLLAQTTVTPLSLNLTTGEVTSAYLSASTCSTLQKFALNLFRVVPKTSRTAAASSLLSRLCAVSPADASTVTVTASVALSVATMIVSVDSSPASLILTVPFAPSGGVMPSSGGGGSPGPKSDSNLVELLLGEPLEPGRPVCVISELAYLARADDPARLPCIGVIESLVDPLTARVRIGGVLATGLAGLTPGRVQFLSAGGALTETPPIILGQYVQPIGFSLTDSTLAVAPSTALAIR